MTAGIRTAVLATLVAVAVVLAGCAAEDTGREPIGHFFAGTDSSSGIAPIDEGLATAVPDPANTLVMIYDHGTDWGGHFQDCDPSTMPSFLKRWSGHGLHGHKVVVFYLCSQQVEDHFVMGTARAQENEVALDRLLAAGVPPRNIFVFGHSGGASTALLLAVRAPQKFNSAIVSGPGYGFAWLEQQGESYPWMDVEYSNWRDKLAGAKDMSALVYLYDGDTYAPPSEAQFLAQNKNVEVINIHDDNGDGKLCSDEPEPHFYWWSSCFRRLQLDHVEKYVVERLADRTWLE